MSPLKPDEPRKFKSMRAHKVSMRAKIKKEGELISSMNQRGITEFADSSSYIDEKSESKKTPSK